MVLIGDYTVINDSNTLTLKRHGHDFDQNLFFHEFLTNHQVISEIQCSQVFVLYVKVMFLFTFFKLQVYTISEFWKRKELLVMFKTNK